MIRDAVIFLIGTGTGSLLAYLSLVAAGYHFRARERREENRRRGLYLDESGLYTQIPPRYKPPGTHP